MNKSQKKRKKRKDKKVHRKVIYQFDFLKSAKELIH